MRRILIFAMTTLLLGGCSIFKQTREQPKTADTFSAADTLSYQQHRRARSEFIKGIRYFEQERYDTSLKHLKAAYELNPDQAGINYALADLYLTRDQLAEAVQYAKKATELKPRNKWFHYKLYQIYRSVGRNQATIDEIQRILQYHPEDTEILKRLAQTYNDYGEPLKAIDVYNRILSLRGPSIRIQLQKLRTFKQLGMADSTLQTLRRIEQLDPTNLNTLHTLGEFYLNRKKPQNARDVLQKALEQNPRHPQILIMMAESYIQQQSWDSAGTMLQNIVSDSLLSSYGKMQVARYMFSQFKQNPDNSPLRQQTRRILTLLTKYEPDHAKSHMLAADFFLETRELTQALTHLEAALEINPHNASVWRERLRVLMAQNQYEQVIELASKANRYAPQDPFISFFVGSAYLISQQHKPAVKWLSQASQLPAKKKFKSVVYSSLGDAYASLDRWERSYQSYEKALKLDSTNHNAMNNYAYYLSKRNKRLEFAKKLALQALELLPGNASYLDTAGWVYYQMGSYQKALKYIKKAAHSQGASATVLEHLGDVYKKLDKMDKAVAWWKKAYQKDNNRAYLQRRIEKYSTHEEADESK